MAEKTKDTQNPQTSVTLETLKLPQKICDARCKICNSDYLKEFHDLKKSGNTYEKICEIMKSKFNFDISEASVSRHFKGYLKRKNILSAQLINNDLVEEATKQSVHVTKLVSLIDNAFLQIKEKLDLGTISLGIDDLDKLIKLRYQVLSGQDTNESDILAIFQTAVNKYGVDVRQGVLFKNK